MELTIVEKLINAKKLIITEKIRSCKDLQKFKWVFPKIMVPQNGWFIMETPIKMDDLGVPLFLETPKC